MPLVPGTRLGNYEVVSSLGAGGMGEVYRARDTRLGREVALKVLPPEVTSEAGRRERFDREARTIAALNHPHIVTIYSTEEVDGVRFITMELVDGQTLSELIVAGGLSLAKFLEIAVPLADALTAAHHKQITHRDLKPGNVMMAQDGRIKVLDFGLARVGGNVGENSMAATLAPVTQHGTIVGTMPYMSPEQVEGGQLDTRSDVFSLGVIFYELLTGERPFQGSSSPALMSAILRDTPPPIAVRRADVPESLTRLIARCLEKRPEDRVQTARDVYNELRHLQKQLDSSATRRAPDSGSRISAATTESLSIAVLPFGVRGTDPEAEAIATGLTEDITASLAKFPGLSVIALQSARAYKDSPLDARQIAERLNARYIISGSARKAGAALRVTASVVDAFTAATLWSENYDRRVVDGDIFTVQDDVTDHIVATVADKHGVLAQSMVQSVRQQTPLSRSTAGDLVLRAWGFHRNPTAAAHAELRDAIEARLAAEPDNPHLWGNLAHLYMAEHALYFNPLPKPLERALRAARRAIELDPSNQQGWETLAMTSFYLGDRQGLQEAAQRAIKINPRNAHTMAWMGAMFGKAGEYDRGYALIERAMQINPSHPGWLHFTVFDRHFARGEFQEALAAARRVNIPEFMWMHFAIAAAAGQLGLEAEGRVAYDAMVRLAPPFADDANLREFVTRWYWQPDMIESLIDGVTRSRQFGSRPQQAAAVARLTSDSGSAVAGTTGITVTPFTARGGDDATTLAEGLTEDIGVGLSRFGNLRVLARNARFVLEGSVRQAGTSLRVSARVVDTASGANVWAENYDRDLATGPFAIQDDIGSRIAAAVGDQTGALANAIASAIADTALDQLGVSELVTRYFGYTMQLREEEHARLRDAFERFVEREPRAADAWACLAMLYEQEHSHDFNPRPDPLIRQRRAAHRAVELNPQSQHAWAALASAHLFERDLTALRGAIERAVSLNPLHADLVALCALFLSVAGDDERAMQLIEHAMRVKPHHPGWYHFIPLNTHYQRSDYEAALRDAKRINMPHMALSLLAGAAAAGQAGRAPEAQSALTALQQTAPALLDPEHARRVWAMWIWNEAFVDRLTEGLQKALALVAPSSGAHTPAISRGAPGLDSGLHSAFTVTVLPFQGPSTGDAATLAEGLGPSVVVGLSRFQYLRVITRGMAREAVTSGYTLQASAREASGVVRVIMQLSDAQTGASVWAETYDRDLRGASVFAVQDDLAATIVATIADTNGALVRSMAAVVRDKPVDALTPYEAVLRRFAYLGIMSPGEHAVVRQALETAVERAPAYAAAWAALAQTYVDEYAEGYNPRPAPLERARAAADKAIELDAASQPAYVALALIGFFTRDMSLFRAAAERTLALNPLDTAAMALLGALRAYLGDREVGLALCARARALHPHHPGLYWMADIVDHFIRRDYEGALAILDRVNMPAYPNTLLLRAAIYAQLGRVDEGRALMREAESRSPGISGADSAPYLRWFTSEQIVHIQEAREKLN